MLTKKAHDEKKLGFSPWRQTSWITRQRPIAHLSRRLLLVVLPRLASLCGIRVRTAVLPAVLQFRQMPSCIRQMPSCIRRIKPPRPASKHRSQLLPLVGLLRPRPLTSLRNSGMYSCPTSCTVISSNAKLLAPTKPPAQQLLSSTLLSDTTVTDAYDVALPATDSDAATLASAPLSRLSFSPAIEPGTGKDCVSSPSPRQFVTSCFTTCHCD